MSRTREVIGRAASLIFRLLIGAYPAAFRRRFGDELVDTFARACASRCRSSGLRAASAFAASAYLDTLACALAERREQGGKRRTTRTGADRRDERRHDAGSSGGRGGGPKRRAAARGAVTATETWADLRFSLRGLRRSPGFASVAVLSLALGIGANAAIFSIVDGVAFRSLPLPDADRLVHLWRENLTYGILRQPMGVPEADLVRWRERVTGIERMEAYIGGRVEVTGDGTPEEVDGLWVSAGFLDLMGLHIASGRSFAPLDAGTPVVVVHDRLARRRFGQRDPLGRTLTIDGIAHVVIGTIAADHTYPAGTEIWRPLGSHVSARPPSLRVIGRLAPGVTPAAAESELDAVAESLAIETPEINEGWRVWSEPLHQRVVGDAGDSLLLLLAAVGFVLLIACANVANLLLVRATTRRQEIAVRAALGAGRARLARQLFMESAVLASCGGGIGLLLARWGLDSLLLLAPRELPRLQEIVLDGRVVAFTMVLTALTSAAFGVVPALRGSRVDGPALRARAGAGSAGRRFGPRDGFVVVQIALGVILMLGAGLLINSFVRLAGVDPGFDPDGVLRVRIELPAHRYEDGDPSNLQFYRDVLERLAAAPGVRHTAFGSNVPMSGQKMVAGIELEDREIDREEVPTGVFGGSDEPAAAIDVQVVSPGYFPLFGIDIVRGRGFTDADASAADQVGIVNETMATILWPGEEAVGKRLRLLGGGSGAAPEPWIRVVGVSGDFKQGGLDAAVRPQLSLPIDQRPAWAASFPSMSLLVAGGDVTGLAAALREAVWSVDPDLPIPAIESMEALVARSVAQPRFLMSILAGFAAAALLLAALGIYGVMAFSVAQRAFEIGVRKALGATESNIVGRIVARAVVLIAIGLSVGLLAAMGLGRYLASVLFEISPTDGPTFIAAAAAFAAVALLASYVPARRAGEVDPVETLRRM